MKSSAVSTIPLLLLVLFSACHEHSENSDIEKYSGKNPCYETEVEISDSIKVNSTTDSSSIDEERSAEMNLFVIENCGLLLRDDGNNDYVSKSEKILDSVTTLLEVDFMSIGSKGIQKQTLTEVYQMKGECGQHQLAIRLQNTECSGLVVPSAFLGDNATIHLLQAPDSNFKHYLVNPMDSLHEEKTFSDTSGIYQVTVNAKGNMQENDWPHFRKLEWSVGIDQQLIGEFTVEEISTTNVPRPLAVIENDTEVIVLWMHQEGICCPSLSKAWFTTFVKYTPAAKWKRSKDFLAGYGQPCD